MKYEKNADKEGHFMFAKYTDEYHPHPRSLDSIIPAFHNSVELFVVENGEFWVYVNGEVKRLTAGDIVYIDRLVLHDAWAEDKKSGLLAYVLVVSPSYLSSISDFENMTFDTYLRANENFGELTSLLEWGKARFTEMNEEMKVGYATLVFGMLKNNYSMHQRVGVRQMQLVFNVLEYIDAHYAERITLEGLASKFGYEKTYLSKVINSFLGMNLREYLNRYRVTKVNGCRKASPGEPISSIAERCGFESANTFYRAYKRYFKLP